MEADSSLGSVAMPLQGSRVSQSAEEVRQGSFQRRMSEEDYIDLRPYAKVLLRRWRLITVAVTIAILIAFLATELLMTKWYRASAVIRPISAAAVEDRISGLLGGNGGGMGASELGGLAASLGAGSSNTDEYTAILQGFQFSTDLVEHHHLTNELLTPPSRLHRLLNLGVAPQPQWQIYRTLQKRFDCDPSAKTGNITITFVARTQAQAEAILGYYIDDLRALLRNREVSGSKAATASLRDEANSQPDPILRTELYDFVARQIRREKMAQMEADFAFRVLDPPAAPDRPYRPRVVLACALAGLLTALVVAALILLMDTRSSAPELEAAVITGRAKSSAEGRDFGRTG